MYVKLTVKMDAHTNSDAQQIMQIKESLYEAFVGVQHLKVALRAPGMEAATALTSLRWASPRGAGQPLGLEFEAVGILRPQPLDQLSEDLRQLTELRVENEELKKKLAWEQQRAIEQLVTYRTELKRLRRLARRRWRSHRR